MVSRRLPFSMKFWAVLGAALLAVALALAALVTATGLTSETPPLPATRGVSVVDVPNVVGMTLSQASAALHGSGLAFTPHFLSPRQYHVALPGTVLTQMPEVGAHMQRGSVILLGVLPSALTGS